ncbi:RNA-directed DNA polymerase, eukaryota [Tanacetum coccineum]
MEDERFVEDKGHTSGELDGKHDGEQDGGQYGKQVGEQYGEQENMNKEIDMVSESKKKANDSQTKEDDLQFPPGFTPVDWTPIGSYRRGTCLIDLPLGGYSFTWTHKSATKMSKLDRFIVSEGLMALFPHLSALFPDRHSSDQRPILMRDMILDYRPTPFWIFHSCFRDCSKDKIRWSIEGDENSKYFHGILNNKQSQLSIHGILDKGDLFDDPSIVKTKFFEHFSNHFSKPDSFHLKPEFLFPNQLSPVQVNDLESESIIEKDAVVAIKAFFSSVDFEKAFDCLRWDYLDDVLKSFGFGNKWCSWIKGCLESAMGSILVNGSPTSEFRFYKGLKQEDPLSPFLIILIMESLHLSFNRVLSAGLFKGISLNESLTLSHLFYADDAVFVGE